MTSPCRGSYVSLGTLSPFSGTLDFGCTTCYLLRMEAVNRSTAVNPLRTLREAAHCTVKEMADLADVTSQAIIRSEQGVYERPLPKLLSALWRYAPESDLHDEGVLLADYHHFQRQVRESNYGRLDEHHYFLSGQPSHPFVAWRLASGLSARISISKLFCVHPALVTKFEMQPHLCSTPPGQLLYALRESGYSETKLDALTDKYSEYRRSLRGGS